MSSVFVLCNLLQKWVCYACPKFWNFLPECTVVVHAGQAEKILLQCGRILCRGVPGKKTSLQPVAGMWGRRRRPVCEGRLQFFWSAKSCGDSSKSTAEFWVFSSVDDGGEQVQRDRGSWPVAVLIWAAKQVKVAFDIPLIWLDVAALSPTERCVLAGRRQPR